MDLIDYVYNGNFLLAKEPVLDFPDGWIKTGGDQTTGWDWLGSSGEPRAIQISHPSGPRAGIIQALDTFVQAGESQRWEVEVILKTEPEKVPCYLKVYLGTLNRQIFSILPGQEPTTVSKVFATPASILGLRMEVGIFGPGKVTIHEVKAYRLYPKLSLRLDSKGQLYVNHVDSIGEIRKPVPVNVVGSLAPVSVDVHATVTSDVRDLSPSRDGIRIYDSTGNPMNTTPEGLMKVQIAGRKFSEFIETKTASVTSAVTSAYDVSNLSIYSFAVQNLGSHKAFVQLEISPDGSVWTVDIAEQEINPGELRYFVATIFLRYNRLKYRAETSTTSLKVWFQAQS